MKTRSSAVPIAAVHTRTKAKALDPALSDQLFSVSDAFEAVAYQLSFTPDARNAAALVNACSNFVTARSQLEHSLTGVAGEAGDLGARLLQTAASGTTACQNPGAVSENIAEAVQLDFGSFREMTFDFSQLVSG